MDMDASAELVNDLQDVSVRFTPHRSSQTCRLRHATPSEGGAASADVAGKAQRVTVEHVMAATNDPWL
jgi:hypothetical protein